MASGKACRFFRNVNYAVSREERKTGLHNEEILGMVWWGRLLLISERYKPVRRWLRKPAISL